MKFNICLVQLFLVCRILMARELYRFKLRFVEVRRSTLMRKPPVSWPK